MLRFNHVLTAMGLMAMAGVAHAAAPAEGGGGGLLDPGGWGAVWNLALFLLLLIVLSKFVWPHILNGLQAREERIRHDLAAAEAANREAQTTLADYKKQLAEAHAEARRLIDQARIDADSTRQRLIADTETEAARLRKRAAEEIEQAKNAATQELYAKAAELSVAVAEKILQRQITDADNQRLIEQSLAELGRKAS